MNIQEPSEKIPTQFLVGNGNENDTQYREIQLGEKQKLTLNVLESF